MNRHLVTVKVSVKRCADQRVQLDRFTFDQHRLERLDTQTVQRRRTVQHHRVLTNHFFENVPDNRLLHLNQFLSRLDRGGQTHQFKFIEDEGLEQLERHQLRQTALMQFQLRTNHNDRTA